MTGKRIENSLFSNSEDKRLLTNTHRATPPPTNCIFEGHQQQKKKDYMSRRRDAEKKYGLLP